MIPDPTASRWWRAAAFALVATCALVAFTSSCGKSAPRSAHRRIISVGGAITETVFALGAGDEVVAVDTSSIYPVAIHALPKVGYQRTLSAEGILALSPDLLIVSEEAGPPATLAQLESAGVKIARMRNARTIDQAADRILEVGKAIDRPAQALADKVRTDATAAAARAKSSSGPTFALIYARGAGTLQIGGDDTAGAAMIALAGGRNAITQISGFKPLSPEMLIAAAPEVLVIPERGLATIGGAAGLAASPGVDATPAGKARRFVAYDDLLLLGFGPRLPSAIDELAARLRAPAVASAP